MSAYCCVQVDSVLFGVMKDKVTVQKWRIGLTSHIIASSTLSSPPLIIREWGDKISSIRTWPSGLSSSALTTSEWYDGWCRPVGGSRRNVSPIKHLYKKTDSSLTTVGQYFFNFSFIFLIRFQRMDMDSNEIIWLSACVFFPALYLTLKS